MRKLINDITVTGVLVLKDMEEAVVKGKEAIRGKLIIRTADNSEHEVNIFSYKFDDNKAERFHYKGYKTVMDEYKDLKDFPDSADIISANGASFGVEDYPNKKDGTLTTYNSIRGSFVNRIEPHKVSETKQEAVFDVEGIITGIEDEIYKDKVTGRVIVRMDAISQTSTNGKYGKDGIFEADSIIPMRLIVTDDMATAFKGTGYYEGCFTKFRGRLVNTSEVTTITEEQAFGDDVEREVKRTLRLNQITSGSKISTIYENELTDDIVTQLNNKRKLHISEVMSKKNKSAGGANTQQAVQPTFNNPFASK